MAVNRRTCMFSGHVQGVGFRYTVHNLAMRHDISGYVRNLPDGRVELVIEGADSEMDRLMEDINDRMAGYVYTTECTSSPATGEFHQFSIRH